MGFIAPVIGPNKSKKLTRLIAPAHNMQGKVWMKNNVHVFRGRKLSSMKPCTLFFIQTLPRILVCRRHKPCEFLGFVWTDCWGNKSYCVTTSPANWAVTLPRSDNNQYARIHSAQTRLWISTKDSKSNGRFLLHLNAVLTIRVIIMHSKGQRWNFWLYRGQTGKNYPILLAMVSKCSSSKYNEKSE